MKRVTKLKRDSEKVRKLKKLKFQDGGGVSMPEPKQDGFAKNNFFNRLFNRNNILEEQIRDEYGALKRIPLRKMHVDLAQGADAETLEQLRHNPEFIGPEEGTRDVQFENVRIPKGKMWVNDDQANPRFVGVRYPGAYTTLIDPRGLSKEGLKTIAANDFVSHALHGDPVYDGMTQELNDMLLKEIGANDLRNNGGVDAYIRGLISDDPEYDAYRQEMGFVPQELKDRIVGYVRTGKGANVERGNKGLARLQSGGISTDGYRRDSPDRFNDFNVIPSNRITMRGVDHPVLGMDDGGVSQVMLPGRDYVFPGRAVLEVPMGGAAGSKNDKIKYGGQIMKKRKMQQGGVLGGRAQNDLYQYVPYSPPQLELRSETHRMGPIRGQLPSAPPDVPIRGRLPSAPPDVPIRGRLPSAPPSVPVRGQLRSAPRSVPPPPQFYVPPTPAMPMDTMMPEHDAEFLRRAELEDWMRRRAWERSNSEYMQDGGGVDDMYEFNNANKMNVMDPYFSSPFYGYYPAGVMPGYGFSAMMGKPLPRRHYQDGGTLEEEAIRNAQYVSEAPTTYSRMVQRNNRDYYLTEAEKREQLRRARGSGDGGAGYVKLMQDWASKGIDPNEMAKQGYIHRSRVPEFMPYYKQQMSAVYTAAPSPVPVTNTTTTPATGTAQVDPTAGFDGEPIYLGNNLDAVIRYRGPNSADQDAEVMYVDRNGKYDPNRGFYRLPATELRRRTGGTRHWQNNADMSQWRVPVPGDLPVADVVAGKRFQTGGPVWPVSGDTSRAMQAGPGRYVPGNYVYDQLLRGDSIPPSALRYDPTRRLVNENMRDSLMRESMLNNIRNAQHTYWLNLPRPQMEVIDRNQDPRNRPMPWESSPRRYQDGGTLEEEAIRNAQYVSEAPKTYSRMVQRDNRDYYLTEAEKREQLRRARGSGDGGAGYVKLMQDWASKGIDPNEMAKQGYIHRSRVPEFMSYYKPQMSAVYTAAPSPVPVTNTTTTPATGTAQVYDPTAGFDGEPIYLGNNLDAVIRYRGPNSADQDAEVMYVDKMGKYDPNRGFYRLPAAELRRRTGGTRHWQNNADMSQWRVPVPGDLPVADVVAGKRFDAGGPYSGGPYYPFGANPYPNFPGNFFFKMNNPILSKDSQRLQGSSGPLTPSEQQQQEMQAVSNSPGFQQFMQTPILSKDSPRLQGTAAPLSEEQLQQQAVQQMFNNPRFQQIMKRGPVLSKDSQRLQDPPDKDPKQQSQTVSYMDPLYGQIGLVGMGAVGHFLDKRNEQRALQESKKKNMSDWFGTTVVGSEGDYVPNSGVFRPKDYVATQFRAYPRGMKMAAEGGTVDPLADVREVPGYLDATVMDVPVIAPPASTEVVDEASAPAVEKGDDMPTPKTDVALGKNAWKAFEYLMDKGWPAHAAAGIVGNLNRESGVDPKRYQNEGGPGRGIAQWTDANALPEKARKNAGDRWNDYLKWLKPQRRNQWGLEPQLDFLDYEASNLKTTLSGTDSPERAAMVFGRKFERPSEQHAAWDERAGAARKIYNEYLRRQGRNQAPQEGRDFNLTMGQQGGQGFDLAAAMGLGNTTMDMGLAGGGSSGGGSEEDQNTGMSFTNQGWLSMGGAEEEEEEGSYERGGEYLVTPKQLKFILANGGEIEFL